MVERYPSATLSECFEKVIKKDRRRVSVPSKMYNFALRKVRDPFA